jgi:hypothetical protein
MVSMLPERGVLESRKLVGEWSGGKVRWTAPASECFA